MKYLFFFFFLFSSLQAEQYITVMEWNIGNSKPFISFEERQTLKILNTDVDVVVLNNVKDVKNIQYFKPNKTVSFYFDNVSHDINTIFLLDKSIKSYRVSLYNNVDVKHFENPPVGIVFEKNNEIYVIVNININYKNRQNSFYEINKLENVINFYSFKESVDLSHIIVTGNFNMNDMYLQQAVFSNYSSTNTSLSSIEDNNLIDNFNNFLIFKKIKYKVVNYKEFLEEKEGYNLNLENFSQHVNNYLPIVGHFLIPDDKLEQRIENIIKDNNLNMLK
jgi:hypothetical protein